MKYISTFERYGLDNPKSAKKDVKSGSGGAKKVFSGLGKKVIKKKLKKKVIKKSLKELKGILVELKDRFKKFVDVDTIEYLKDGSFGMAFSAGDKVIKITTNQNEYLTAMSLIGRKLKGCVKYYDVYPIEKYKVIAILMDKADNLTKDEEDILDMFDQWTDPVNRRNNIDDILNGLVMTGTEITMTKLKWYLKKYEELVSTLEDQDISTRDLHSGNIGWIKGKLVHFDIM